jgi:hypothetical protein
MHRDSIFQVHMATIIISLVLAGGAVPALALPAVSEHLDRLAADIARMGYVPRGGDLLLLASANGWFGIVNDVILHPASVDWREVLEEYGQGSDACFAGSWSTDNPGLTVVVTAPPRELFPSGLPASLMPGDTVTFRIGGGWEDLNSPILAMELPDMTVLDMDEESDGSFTFVAAQPGVYWIELLEEGDNGPEVLLLFPLVSGGSARDVLDGRIPYPFSMATSAEEILEELNMFRASKGLLPLERDAALDSIARIRACDLSLSGSTSHFSDDGTGLGDLLHGYGRYAENIGRGTGFDEAWSMLLISPMHLRTCLDPGFSMIGTGASVDMQHDQWQIVLVQVFTSGDLH